MKPLLLIAAIYAALVAVNHLNPGPGEADVRGKSVTVGNIKPSGHQVRCGDRSQILP
jgi:hypothetical protein